MCNPTKEEHMTGMAGYQDAATTESATFAVELFGENNEAVSSNR
jgi:hypothetical protein